MTCDAIADGGKFPELFLGPGHGANVAPVLRWSGAPGGAAAFALTLTDDDAPDYVHLVALVGGSTDAFDVAHMTACTVLGQGTRMFGYEGPCPPVGVHHYRFTLRALSKAPALQAGFTAAQLEEAIAGTVLGQATLEASYNAGLGRQVSAAGGRVLGFLRRRVQPQPFVSVA